jgi:integrase
MKTQPIAKGWVASTIENFNWANGDRLRTFRQVKGIESPDQLTDPLFYEFFDGLRQAGLTDSSRIKLRNCIRQFLTWSKERGLRSSATPELKIRPPRQSAPDHLLPEEITQVLDTCRNDRDQLIVKLMIYSGLRVGEITAAEEGEESALTLGMLDLNSIHPCIRGVSSRKENDTDEPMPIPLIDGIDKEIKKFVARRPQTKSTALFLTSRKFGGEYQPLTRSAAQSMVRRLKHDCEIRQLHPHALRHTFGILMVDTMGVNWTRQVMRHSRSSTTDRYLRAREEVVLAAAQNARIRLPKKGQPK